MDQLMQEHIEKIVTQDTRYRADAYAFIMEGLSFTQKRLARECHVTGQELLIGIRELAVKKFGAFALQVFHAWGIRSTEDVGHIVFNMVESGMLGKRDEDSFESFRNGFDFAEAFHADYRRQLNRTARRIR